MRIVLSEGPEFVTGAPLISVILGAAPNTVIIIVQEGQAPYLGYLRGFRLNGATLFLPHNTQQRYSIFLIETKSIL